MNLITVVSYLQSIHILGCKYFFYFLFLCCVIYQSASVEISVHHYNQTYIYFENWFQVAPFHKNLVTAEILQWIHNILCWILLIRMRTAIVLIHLLSFFVCLYIIVLLCTTH
uniref:Uncharacterized protein n=1 Tax=Panstrongylus lignarius TaxID=156445 RepID=A0A224Y283_9HEMI